MGSRWRIEFDARLPGNPDSQWWRVGIAPALLEVLQKNGHTIKQMRVMLIEEVLQETSTIFEGWSRPETDGCFVYAGRPTKDYRGRGIEVPPPPGMMFLVFVLPDGTIDDWNWRPVSEDSHDLPEGVKGKILWRQI